LKEECLTIVFAKGAWFALDAMAATGTDGLGIDWCITPQLARKMAGDNVTLQGNFDPAKLLAPTDEIRKSVKQMVDGFGNHRYIANLGHGILPNVPVDHARAFVDAVKDTNY
jgi:uroporphyrinogen decarboxylase